MSRNKPDIAEQRLQVLEVLSERLQRLDELVREVKGDSGKIEEEVKQIRITLSNMQGANLNEQVKDNKGEIVRLDERMRTLEDFKSNLLGKMAAAVFVASIVTAIMTGLAVKLLGGH